MLVEIVISGISGLSLGIFLQRLIVKIKHESFEITLKNVTSSIIRIFEDSKKDESVKLKMIKNHITYLSGEFRQTKNM